MTLTLITPTGDRPEAFRLCETYIRRQTYRGPLQWIVVDDGARPTPTTCGQHVIRRLPRSDDPPHTLCRNLRMALPHVAGDCVCVIEDDDYYAPEYLQSRLDWLQTAPLVGERGAKYYYLDSCRYRHFVEHEHASLCRTAFTREVLPRISELAEDDDWRLDLRLWNNWQGGQRLEDDRNLSASFKVVPGRCSQSQRINPSWTLFDDRNLTTLKCWTGDAWRHYLPWLGVDPPPDVLVDDLLVYTVCVGGYDTLQCQPAADKTEYLALTDAECVPPPWTRRRWRPPADLGPRRGSRLPKIRPGDFFGDESRPTLYVDANVRFERPPRELAAALIRRCPAARVWLLRHNVRSTVAEEAEAVVRYGFADEMDVRRELSRLDRPETLPLAWGGLILRAAGTRALDDLWWSDYTAGSGRDQLSLTSCVQRAGIAYALCDLPFPVDRDEPGQWLTHTRHAGSRGRVE